MNNKYINEIQKEQKKDNINNFNPNLNFNLNDKNSSTDFSKNPIRKEKNNMENINKNSYILIQNEDNKSNKEPDYQINNNILTKDELNKTSGLRIDKLQELLESKKVINTLCSIKTSTSLNMNYEEIKLLPDLFFDMQEALKKSNQNVLELKNTIKEKINLEKKLKQKIKIYESENKDLNEKIYIYKSKESKLLNENYNLKNKVTMLEEAIEDNQNLKKRNDELLAKIDILENKNKKYKNSYGLLQNKLNDINEKSEKENYSYMNTIKDMKKELKNQLTEKMALLQEINDLKNIVTKVKEENLKLKEDFSLAEKTKEKFEHLFNEYKKLNLENDELNIELKKRENISNSNKELFDTINDKYEQEEFELKSEINIWKNNFLNITKFKLYNYDPKILKNVEKLLKIEEKYIINAPPEMVQVSEQVLNFCKNLIEGVNYNTINLKDLKEELTKEQETNMKLNELWEKEKFLRRKIHNRYMYLRGNLRVMSRLRPFLPNEMKNKKSQMETIIIKNDSIIIDEMNKQPKIFEFDYVFNERNTQEEVYDEVSLLIQSMIHGNNICIMSYGQTCTGKTYTIQGEEKNEGIVPRASQELFDIIQNLLKKKNNVNQKKHKNFEDKNNIYYTKYKITITIIEIYNEQVYNLLEESTPNLNLYEDSNGNLIIPDLSPININSFEEAKKLFKLAEKFRRTASTEFNERSSRSHCLYTFHLKLTDSEDKITRSNLHIIDLAGSERISKGQNINEKIKKEAISINLSLHSLSNVLYSIANKSNHIPYRDSKLTHFLKDSLNDNYNILLLLHISPNIRDLSETISTLQFGERIVKFCHHKTGKEKMQLINNNNVNK